MSVDPCVQVFDSEEESYDEFSTNEAEATPPPHP